MSHSRTAHDLLERATHAEPLLVDAAVAASDVVSRAGSLLRCRVVGGWWLLDAKARRLCRTSEHHDPVFIADEYWEPFRRAAVGDEWAIAELADGRVVRASLAVTTA